MVLPSYTKDIGKNIKFIEELDIQCYKDFAHVATVVNKLFDL